MKEGFGFAEFDDRRDADDAVKVRGVFIRLWNYLGTRSLGARLLVDASLTSLCALRTLRAWGKY